MVSKAAEEIICFDCGAEYIIKYDEDEVLDEPIYCPFCGTSKNPELTDELNFDVDT